MTPSEIHNTLGLTQVSPALTPVQGFGFEFFLGFILIFVVFGICDLHRPESKPTAALIIGLTVSLGHLFGVSIISFLDFTLQKSNFENWFH